MLAFVHIEKAAGTSVHQILKRSYGMRYCPVEAWRFDDAPFSARDLRWLGLLYPRLLALGGHCMRPYGDLPAARPDVRWWTLLREPLARCASHYQYQVQRMGKREPFEAWIANPRYRDFQTRKLVGTDDAEAAIRTLEERFVFVGLAERFDESMLLLRRLLGDERLKLVYEPDRPENVAADDAPKRELLGDPQQRARLEAANRADLRVYEYVLRVLYPRAQAAYGEDLERDLARLREAPLRPGADWRRRLSDLKRYALYKPALWLVRGREG